MNLCMKTPFQLKKRDGVRHDSVALTEVVLWKYTVHNSEFIKTKGKQVLSCINGKAYELGIKASNTVNLVV